MTHLGLGEWCWHIFQQAGQILLTVAHHQEDARREKTHATLCFLPSGYRALCLLEKGQPHERDPWGRTASGNHTPLQVVAHNHLLQLYNIWMAETQEQRDLTQAADGNACNQRGSVNSTSPHLGPHKHCPLQVEISDTNTVLTPAFIGDARPMGRGTGLCGG